MNKILLSILLAVLLCPIQKILAFPGAEQIYIKPMPSLQLTLDPQLMEDSYSFHVASQIYDTLLRFDEFLTLKPHLAESFQTSDDGKVIIIKLRTDVKFHDGKPLDVNDVVFTIQHFIKKTRYRYPEILFIKGANDFLSGRSKTVSGLNKTSNLSLTITLNSASPTFLMLLATPNFGILSSSQNRNNDDLLKLSIGTGPFKIESYKLNQELILMANKDYFAGKPKLNKLIYKYASKEAAIDGFNKGAFHDLEWYNPKPDEIKASYNVIKFPVPKTGVLLFNTKVPPFNNKLIRQAFSAAINKEKIMSECFSDKIAANGFIPFGIGGYDNNFPAEEFNVAKAKEILSLLKIKKPLKVEILWLKHHPCSNKFEQIIKTDLNSAGFEPNVNYITYKEFLEITNSPHNYNIIETRLSADYPDALSILNYFKSNYKYNFSGFTSKKYDGLYETALKEVDRYERYKLYQESQKILREENAVYNLYYDMQAIVYQKSVRGVKDAPISFLMMSLNSIYFEE